MECLLCSMWARMPYAKRYTTPTTADQTQGALVVGYWIARRAQGAPRICEGHLAVLEMLDKQEENRIASEQQHRAAMEQARQDALPPPEFQGQVATLQERQQAVLNPQPEPVRVVMPPITVPNINEPPPPPPVAQTGGFKLGPGPLTNENSTTAPPPLPVVVDPSAPYKATPGTIEGALEAARMPAVEGGKVTYPCPSCGKEISTGDVHAC